VHKHANEILKSKYISVGIYDTLGNANFTPKRATLALFTRHVSNIKLDANSSEGREKGVPFLFPSESTPFVAFPTCARLADRHSDPSSQKVPRHIMYPLSFLATMDFTARHMDRRKTQDTLSQYL
jgi:hypothetical protein